MSANISRDYTSSMHLGRLDQLVLAAACGQLFSAWYVSIAKWSGA